MDFNSSLAAGNQSDTELADLISSTGSDEISDTVRLILIFISALRIILFIPFIIYICKVSDIKNALIQNSVFLLSLEVVVQLIQISYDLLIFSARNWLASTGRVCNYVVSTMQYFKAVLLISYLVTLCSRSVSVRAFFEKNTGESHYVLRLARSRKTVIITALVGDILFNWFKSMHEGVTTCTSQQYTGLAWDIVVIGTLLECCSVVVLILDMVYYKARKVYQSTPHKESKEIKRKRKEEYFVSKVLLAAVITRLPNDFLPIFGVSPVTEIVARAVPIAYPIAIVLIVTWKDVGSYVGCKRIPRCNCC